MSIRIFAAVHFWGGSGGLWGVFFGGVIQLSGCTKLANPGKQGCFRYGVGGARPAAVP
jgi:hypothetical protein